MKPALNCSLYTQWDFIGENWFSFCHQVSIADSFLTVVEVSVHFFILVLGLCAVIVSVSSHEHKCNKFQRYSLLGVICYLCFLKLFSLLLRFLSLEVRDLIKLSYLRLIAPKSITLYTLASCRFATKKQEKASDMISQRHWYMAM